MAIDGDAAQSGELLKLNSIESTNKREWMDIRLAEGQYRSITALEWSNIPRLAVITGSNGSGKTQLLELIAASAGVFVPEPGQNHPRMWQPEPLNARLECSERLDAGNTVFLRSFWDTTDTSASIQRIYELANEAWRTQGSPEDTQAAAIRGTKWDSLWATLEQITGVSRGNFDRDLFDSELPPNFFLMQEGATQPASMHASIPLLFVSYAAKAYRLRLEGADDEEIGQMLGPLPWESVDNALEQAGLQYKVRSPVVQTQSWARNFELSYRLELEHKRTGAVVPVNALSSGERVVFLASVWSYFFSQAALKTRTALLLLDEPDAHLHPALTKSFLRVIRHELVERHGIRVVITTHSPSTVALTDEEDLFLMTHEEPRIKPVANKWEAVAHLTSGLVTVGTETKAVFVEDKSDVEFFQAVQAILAGDGKRLINFEVTRSLNFIPASRGRAGGGKNAVIEWVKTIETSQVAGIVDRDEEREPGGRIYVGERRHLESYLLDPLFIYALLLDDNKAGRPNFVQGIDHRHSRTLLDLEPPLLQGIIDGMVLLYAELLGHKGEDIASVEYLGGPTLSIPMWVLHCDMKRLFEPLRRRLDVTWNPEYLTRKYEVLRILPKEIAQILVTIQQA